jgi:hypothetical protein
MTAVLLGLLVAAVGGSYLRMRSSRLSAADAARSVQLCRELVVRIEQLQVGPRRAGLQSRSETELSRKIESAAKAAGLPRNYIVRIDPGEPRRVADSDYKDQSTDVELRPVTLKQLVAFLDAITSDTGIQVNFVWLTAPTPETPTTHATEPWNAQMTLTNLIFTPKS